MMPTRLVDYGREEWLERKKENLINNTANEIYELHKRTNNNQLLSKAEKMKALSGFSITSLPQRIIQVETNYNVPFWKA